MSMRGFKHELVRVDAQHLKRKGDYCLVCLEKKSPKGQMGSRSATNQKMINTTFIDKILQPLRYVRTTQTTSTSDVMQPTTFQGRVHGNSYEKCLHPWHTGFARLGSPPPTVV